MLDPNKSRKLAHGEIMVDERGEPLLVRCETRPSQDRPSCIEAALMVNLPAASMVDMAKDMLRQLRESDTEIPPEILEKITELEESAPELGQAVALAPLPFNEPTLSVNGYQPNGITIEFYLCQN